MEDILLFDTDMLIDYLRSRAEAVEYLESLLEPPIVSAITIAELYAGVREGKERMVIEKFIEGLIVVPISREIATRGGLLRRDYFKSYGVGLADAIIAATAEIEQATLVTLNKKHFPMLSKVYVPLS